MSTEATMKLLVCLTLLQVLLVSRVSSSPCDYNIVAPKAIRLGDTFYFNVDYECSNETDHNATFALKASIEAWNRWGYDRTIVTLASKQFIVSSGNYKRFALEVPRVKHGKTTLNFTVEASGSEEFRKSSPIQNKDKYLSLFIQTDKHFYKPGQTVHYRVLAYDGYLKPYNKVFNITIHDNRRNLIVQRLNERNDFGIHKGELKLSPVTPPGSWKLTAKCEDAIKTVYFDVKEYVLPKYKIEILSPNYYLVLAKSRSGDKSSSDDSGVEDFKFDVSAKYTFGKPVRGIANVHFTLANRYWDGGATPSYSKVVHLKAGKANVSVSHDELLSLIPCKSDHDRLSHRSIRIKATVVEQETGKELVATKTVSVKTEKYKLEYLRQNNYFKAGFLTREFLQLKHVNLKKPLPEDLMYPNGTMKSLAVRVTYKMANYSSSIENRFLTAINKNGLAVIELRVHNMVEKIQIEAVFYDNVLEQKVYAPYKSLTAIRTRDSKLLDLQLKGGKGYFKPNQESIFTLNASEPINTFYYQLFGKNVLVLSEKVVGESNKNHEFSIQVTEKLALQLAPRGQLVVFYINSLGELVADGLKLEVEDYFANKVSATFDESKVLPGSNVTLNIHAPQDSHVGYFAIDQSVLLMGSYDLFTEQQIESDLGGYLASYFPNWNRKKRSVIPHDVDLEEEEETSGKLMWPVHTLARCTSELLSNAGVLVFSSSHIHRNYHYNNDYFYSDLDEDGVMESPMRAMDAPAMPGVRMHQRQMSSNKASPPPVRKNFPETWFWVDYVKTSSEDHQEVLTVPDTITEWVVSAFSASIDKGIGVSESAHLTVFQPLFLSINLPPSIIRGEELALTITLFNYLPETVNATVTLKKSDKYKVKSCDSENINNLLDHDVVRTFEVEANDVASFHVWFVATAVGQVPIEVEAISAGGSDAVSRKLLVKPEGEQQIKARSSYIKPTPSSPSNTSFRVQLPPEDIYVPDSAFFQVTSIGDILASVTNNIGNIISVPRGCGEQNIVNLAPLAYSLSYLDAANISDPQLRGNLKSGILSGYRQQLAFYRSDKSYSAFGNDDAAGSAWLTAFVLKSLQEASEHIFIPVEHFEDSLKWLLQWQSEDGSFQENPESRIIHSKMQGGSKSTLTPFVLIALLRTQNSLNNETSYWLQDAILSATNYVEKNLDSYHDKPYDLSIAAYALHLAGSDKLPEVLERLDELATEKDSKLFWKDIPKNNSDTHKDDLLWIAFGEQPPTHEIEMTAYNLLIRVERGDIEKALPVAQWLIENGNGRGGFVSTQDTVLALEALSKFAALIVETNDPDVTINFTVVDQEGQVQEFQHHVDKVNGLVLHMNDLPKNTTLVVINAYGHGFALLQLLTGFNTFTDQASNDLHLQVVSKLQDKQINLTIDTWWSGEEKSGMVLLEVKSLTGYVLHDVDMLRLQLRGVVKKVEVIDDVVNFYIDELKSSKRSISMLFDQDLLVHGTKPASVQVYSYYQPSTRAVKYYTKESGTTWVSACPQCCE